MPAAQVELNAAQVAVLRWIADGCPDGVMEGTTHKISASALRSRELVRTSGRGKTWAARATDKGRAYLEQLDPAPSDEADETPDHPQPEPPTADRAAPREAVDERPSVAKERRPLKTEQLVADVIAAGGTLRVPDETAAKVNFHQRAYAAQRHGKVPNGKHLTVSRVGQEFEIVIHDGPPATPPLDVSEPEVPIPERVSRYHPVAQTFRERTAIHEVSRAALPRVLRIIHGLAKEIERRGHSIACVKPETSAYGRSSWSPANDGQLVVTVNGHSASLRIKEKGVGQRGPWEHQRQVQQERRDRGDYMWLGAPIEPYDKHATGQLEIALHGRTRWADRKRWTLEDRLGGLLQTVEAYAEQAEQRRLEAERAAQERQRQWEEAMRRAKVRFIEHHHAETLRRRVRAWQEADAILAYCDAIEQKHGSDAIAADPDAGRWITFAREQAHQAQELPRMPPDPEPTAKDLEPFLGGHSPYGPRRW